MDHSGLGAGRRSAVLALSSSATSRAAFGGYRFARRRIRSPGAQSSRAQLSSARRVPDFQLVSLHIRNRDGLPVRRCAITGAAAQSRAWTQCGAVTLRARPRPGFFTVNIEIADYFSTPGVAALTFQFSGNFARDMSYSITWALFALLLL